MKKLGFICTKGLETFIDPIAKEFERLDGYQVRRFYVQTNQEVIGAVKWSDVVWLEWANQTAILATQIYELKKKTVICRLHSYEALTSFPEQIDWSRVDYLVFVADHIREIVKKHVPDIEDKVKTLVVPNGIDIAKAKPNKVLNMLDIAYVCAFNSRKNNAMMLQIVAELVKKTGSREIMEKSGSDIYQGTGTAVKLGNPAFRVHSAGKFQEEHLEIYMKHMAKDLGIEDNIIFYGQVSDMDSFWEGKGTVLSTSIHEGHPLNVMEGAARGLRPVVHNFMGARDLYPASWLFNTVDEAVEVITRDTGTEDAFRAYIIGCGWTLEAQINQFKELVEKAGEAEK